MLNQKISGLLSAGLMLLVFGVAVAVYMGYVPTSAPVSAPVPPVSTPPASQVKPEAKPTAPEPNKKETEDQKLLAENQGLKEQADKLASDLEREREESRRRAQEARRIEAEPISPPHGAPSARITGATPEIVKDEETGEPIGMRLFISGVTNNVAGERCQAVLWMSESGEVARSRIFVPQSHDAEPFRVTLFVPKRDSPVANQSIQLHIRKASGQLLTTLVIFDKTYSEAVREDGAQ